MNGTQFIKVLEGVDTVADQSMTEQEAIDKARAVFAEYGVTELTDAEIVRVFEIMGW